MTTAEHIEPGILGAKRASWRKTNTRDTLWQIIEKHPDATEVRWRSLFLAAIKDDAQRYLDGDIEDEDSLFNTAVYAHFGNVLRAVKLGEHKPEAPEVRKERVSSRKAESEKAASHVKEHLKKRIVEEARIMLLQLEMPNGKTLGQCTGQECGQFKGWYSQLEKLVPARKRVADQFSEDELWSIWKKHK